MWEIADTCLANKAERIDYWKSFLHTNYTPSDMAFCAPDEFRCRAEMNRVNELKITVGSGCMHKVFRSHRGHDYDREVFTINVNLFGSIDIIHNNQQIQLQQHEFTMLDQDKDYSIIHNGDYKMLTLEIPRHLLSERLRRPELFLAKKFNGNKGLGGLAFRFFEILPNMLNELESKDESLFEDSLLSVVTNVLKSQDKWEEVTTVGVCYLQRATDFIARNLGESSLTRDQIAENAGLSVRELNRLFALQGTSITRYLKQQRLVFAANMLSDCSFKKVTISEIAYRSGFGDLSHFSCSFRNKFNVYPKEYRLNQLRKE